MCWCTCDKIFTYPKIAKHDIPVFKIVVYDKVNNNIVSWFRSFSYNLGETYGLDIKWRGQQWTVNKGFHSYSELCTVKKNNYGELQVRKDGTIVETYDTLFRNNGAIMHCIIPAGAQFLENGFGEIVSNQLKIVSIYQQF